MGSRGVSMRQAVLYKIISQPMGPTALREHSVGGPWRLVLNAVPFYGL
jgi:hypothetical protein